MAKLDTISSENDNIKVRRSADANARRVPDTKATYRSRAHYAESHEDSMESKPTVDDNADDAADYSEKPTREVEREHVDKTAQLTKNEDTPKSSSDIRSASRSVSSLRGRDTVYVDSDDDVTSLIERVTASEQSVVALVPSAKRGVLNSLVNLKLIRRAAERYHKKITIITTESSLISIASSLSIPVAKSVNAQSTIHTTKEQATRATEQPKRVEKVDDLDKPEPQEEQEEDVIDGMDVPVGELDDMAKSADDIPEDEEISAAVASIEVDDKHHNDLDANGVNDDKEKRDSAKRRRERSTVPNFGAFRAKFVSFLFVVVVVGGFAAWAIMFAPHTDIIIKAKTIPKDIKANLSLIPNAKLDVKRGVVPVIVKSFKSSDTVQFDATGTREQGNKATGDITICNKKPIMLSLTSLQQNVVNIKAGTQLRSASGKIYTLDAPATVKGYSIGNGADVKQNCVSAKATAANIGDEFNVEASTKLSISGYSADAVSAVAANGFTGGTKKTVKVVTRQDVDSALAKLKEQNNADEQKRKLEEQLKDERVIEDSFTQQAGAPKSTPDVNQVSEDGKASLTVEVTYSLLAVKSADMKEFLSAKIEPDNSQQVYDTGLSKLEFKQFKAERRGYTVNASTVGYVGPVIKEDDIKSRSVGKKQAEIKQELMKIPGVQDVTVNMSPFWVSTPSSANKIGVKFSINQ